MNARQKTELENMETVVSKNMTIGEVVEKYPQTAEVMQAYGLHCIGCHVNPFETLEQGAMGHGMPKEMLEEMLEKVNEAAKTQGVSEKEITKTQETTAKEVFLTKNAAKKALEFREKEGKNSGFGLRVAVSPGGCAGFMYQLEFDKTSQQDDVEFEQNGLKLIVSKSHLPMLAGTTIDYVDSLEGSGFKIENPNSTGACGCGKSFH